MTAELRRDPLEPVGEVFAPTTLEPATGLVPVREMLPANLAADERQ